MQDTSPIGGPPKPLTRAQLRKREKEFAQAKLQIEQIQRKEALEKELLQDKPEWE